MTKDHGSEVLASGEPRVCVESATGEVTQLLDAWSHGDRAALNRLMPLVYRELRRLARHHLRQASDSLTLQPTALVNEAYLSLTGTKVDGFHNRHQFFGLASTVLRRILVDHLRARVSDKRGGGAPTLPLEFAGWVPQAAGLDLSGVLGLHQALEKLEAIDPRRGRLVELRYFGGFTMPEIADLLQISLPTVERDWRVARRWLARQLGSIEGCSGPTT